ncbi:MAG: Glycosyl transferase group 1 [Candidatus Giovannonibacteria bacterium GW2011_GWA2_44_13b]|uniref:Glycosyl transferase group 1 n=2 Tax=Candidatus Giovannoniibacteriota TaxID=1752738 RepID=A0A0G1H2Q7_9BACT|nr:MAG: Glycosyl transferase group 1 [Candidatus Giovannonibacteria bacterium GW2011_GWA2_44_13b]OGF83275.1 MAG: hypothetical protein A2924_02315 [Candidatus Giovannonibacteria bacterium RIFCSPLOWO2_01_FULL_44_16]
MKIGFVLHPYNEKNPGGLERAILGWLEALIANDRENEYIIFLKNMPAALPKFTGSNWHTEILGGGYFWLERLKNFPVGIYIFNTPVLPIVFRPKKSIVVAFDFPYKHLPSSGPREWLFRKFIGFYHKRSFKRTSAVIATSDSTKQDVIKLFGVPSKKVRTIPHGFTKVCSLPEENIGLPEAPFFLYVGVIKERKNVLGIIKAFELFKKNNPGMPHKLAIGGRFGVGTYPNLIKKYLAEHNLEHDVILLGYLSQNQLSFVYRRAEALVSPTFIDGFGLPILEAMNCGIPVITSNISGPAELGRGGAAILVDPYNIESIAESMGKLTKNAKLRKTLIAVGLTRASEFTWQKTASETLGLIRTIQ